MKNFFIITIAFIGAVCVITVANIGSYHLYAYLAPKYESTRRDVMLNARTYDEGTKRELYRMQREYQAAKTDKERQTIASAARHEFEIYPRERLPSDLVRFMDQVK